MQHTTENMILECSRDPRPRLIFPAYLGPATPSEIPQCPVMKVVIGDAIARSSLSHGPGGEVAIAYYDATNDDLKIAIKRQLD
jgi:hypothetical protein